MLHPISPCTVRGLGGSFVTAIGTGNIHLHVARGANIVLQDALYIPNATAPPHLSQLASYLLRS